MANVDPGIAAAIAALLRLPLEPAPTGPPPPEPAPAVNDNAGFREVMPVSDGGPEDGGLGVDAVCSSEQIREGRMLLPALPLATLPTASSTFP